MDVPLWVALLVEAVPLGVLVVLVVRRLIRRRRESRSAALDEAPGSEDEDEDRSPTERQRRIDVDQLDVSSPLTLELGPLTPEVPDLACPRALRVALERIQTYETPPVPAKVGGVSSNDLRGTT